MRFRFFCAASAVALAFTLWTPAQAQVVHGYGLRIGGNASTVVMDFRSVEYRPGFQIAAYAELFRTPVLSVQLEAEYARRGYADQSEERGPQGEFIRQVRAVTALDYLSFPVLARLRYPGEQRVTPYMLAGPRLDYLVGRTPGTWEFTEVTVEDELSSQFAEVTVSATVGAGAAFAGPFGRETRLEARLTEGLRDMLREEGTGRARNRSLELSVGIAF
jgi:opacity protein-like surface antigen